MTLKKINLTYNLKNKEQGLQKLAKPSRAMRGSPDHFRSYRGKKNYNQKSIKLYKCEASWQVPALRTEGS